MANFKKLKVGIIGSGNIGSDLMMKIIRSDYLKCTIFAGRNFNSDGMKNAINLGITVSDLGIKSIIKNPEISKGFPGIKIRMMKPLTTRTFMYGREAF